jgi:sec-independent protein translocase protein TatA
MHMGTGELLLVLAVVLLVFGPNKLPQFGDALGRGIRNFKKAASELGATPEPRAHAAAALPRVANTAQPRAESSESSESSEAAHA